MPKDAGIVVKLGLANHVYHFFIWHMHDPLTRAVNWEIFNDNTGLPDDHGPNPPYSENTP